MTIASLSSHLLFVLEANAVWSAILLAIVLPATMLLRRAAPQLRHLLWSIVLVRLVLPPGFALPVSATALLRNVSAVTPVDDRIRAALSIVVSAQGPTSWSLGPTTLACLWFAGFAITALLLFRRRFAIVHAAAAASAVHDASLTAIVDEWRKRYRIRRRVELRRTDSVGGAFTVGTIHPVVVLPTRLCEGLDTDAVECVLAHELAHVRRFDDLTLIAQAIVQSVYFFHPVAWIAGAMRTEEVELACDQLAVSTGAIEPRAFGRGILDVARLNLATVSWPSAFLGRKRRISMRIKSLVTARPSNRLVTLCAVLLGIFLLPMADLAARPNPVAAPEPPAAKSDKSTPPRVEGDVVPPRVATKVDPAYPEDARKDKVQGAVILDATIDKTGRVTGVEVVKSPDERLSKAAAEALRQWTFEPATLHGEPIRVLFTITIRFALS